MAIAGASKMRIFTATWPPFALGVEDDRGGAGRNGVGQQGNGPQCQVVIQTAPISFSEGALNSGVEDSRGARISKGDHSGDVEDDDNLVFFERSLLIRSYNSLSLSYDGMYRLTLSNCHGVMTAPTTALSGIERPKHGGDEKVETARLLFLPLPVSIEFEVNSQGKMPKGSAIIGNFHLLPVAHVPPPPPPPAPVEPSALNIKTTSDITDPKVHQAIQTGEPMPPKLSSALEGGLHAKFAPGSEELCGRSTPGVVFIAGTLVGVLACLFCLWLVVARRWGRRAWAKHTKRSAAELKRGCRVGRHGKKRGWVKGEEETSDDDSSDNDTVNGNVPDPVGLPRSEEDWRALFDTLYEDEQDRVSNAAEANATTPCLPCDEGTAETPPSSEFF